MSFAGHVLCQRMLIGPWALTTVGAVTVAAVTTAAPRRNLRRLVWLGREDCDMASPWLLMDAIRPREIGSVGRSSSFARVLGSACLKFAGKVPSSGGPFLRGDVLPHKPRVS